MAHRKTVMELKLLGNRVMLEMLEVKNPNGLVIPEKYSLKLKGKVVAIGTGRKLKDGTRTPVPVYMGEEVLISPMAGERIRWQDKDYTLVNANDIIGVYEDEKSYEAYLK